jgi:5-methylcytosine-specific restriction endonuclease McrA
MSKTGAQFTVHDFRRRLRLRMALKRYVVRRDGNTCQYCGARGKRNWRLTLDHRLPVGRGGTGGAGNLWACCKRCNLDKGQRTEEEYRAGRPLPRRLR